MPIMPTINAFVKEPVRALAGNKLGGFIGGILAGKIKTLFMYPIIVMQVKMRCDTGPKHVR